MKQANDQETQETLQKLTEGQRKYLLKNYGNHPDVLKVQAERTLYFLKQFQWSTMDPQKRSNLKKNYKEVSTW